MRPAPLLASLLGVFALLSTVQCAVKQPPPVADELKSVVPPEALVPPAWKVTRGTPGAVATQWVSTFGDPQLEAIVKEGLENNLDLKAAVARVDVAAGLVAQAKALMYPQLALISGAGVVGRDDTRDRSGIIGEVSWELDLWGRVRAQAAASEAARAAADADLLYARQSLAATIATLWYHTVATETLRRTAENASGVYGDLLKLVKTRYEVGRCGLQDVAMAGADLDRSRQRERAYATSGQQFVRGLEIVVGRYPAAELALATDLPPMPGAVPEGLPSELLERRPDLVAAERRVASAFHLIQVAEAARIPRIALTAGGGRSSGELFRLAGIGTGFWTAGISLLAPLFTGGALQAQVRIATAEQQAAVVLYGQTALRAFSEVETSLVTEQLLLDQEQYLVSVLKQDTEALRLGRIRYNVGATNLLDVLQLQTRQLNTQFDLIGIRGDRLGNRVALHLALGGGFELTPTP
jgi:outer membrane protein, multidrug efflux system